MKNIILENAKGQKKEFRILFTINTENSKNYAIVTDDESYKEEYIKSFVFTYKLNKKTKKYSYSPVKNEKELDYIDRLLKSLQIESENVI